MEKCFYITGSNLTCPVKFYLIGFDGVKGRVGFIIMKEYNFIEFHVVHCMNYAQGIPQGKDHLISCNDLNYINSDILEEGIRLIEDAKKLLNGFISFISKKIK